MSLSITEVSLENLPLHYGGVLPRSNAAKLNGFGLYELVNPSILAKPRDVPDSHIACNPSAIWTLPDGPAAGMDVMSVRVEPDRANALTSHLGKSVSRPYLVDINNPTTPLQSFDDAMELRGEDPSLTRIKRRLHSGKLEEIWLLSVVDPEPWADSPNEVRSLYTRFHAGTDLGRLKHIADGPAWMKDIVICQAEGPLGTELDVYGRPQPIPFSGNISHVRISSIEDLTADVIESAPIIDHSLAPIGGPVWIGSKDVINVGPGKRILPAHRAWRTGPDGKGRHYETVFYGHNTQTGKIFDLGIVATADRFSGERTVKNDETVDTSDVVFTGGGYNGTLDHMSFGISDGCIGISGLRRLAA